MSKAALSLLILAILLELFGFAVGNAERVPFVGEALWPDHSRAARALHRLESRGVIVLGDIGFEELVQLFWTDSAREGHPRTDDGPEVVEFRRPRGGHTIEGTRGGVGFTSWIGVSLSDGSTVEGELQHLQALVSDMGGGARFTTSIGCMLLGLALMVLGFIVQVRSGLGVKCRSWRS